MPLVKRKRAMGSRPKQPYAKRAKFAAKRGRTGYANIVRTSTINRRVNNLYRMIETKEGCYNITDRQLAHNNIYVWTQNPLATVNGTQDPMAVAAGNRIGDAINLRGVSATFFLEGSLGRSKVHFRVLLLKGCRGASFSRADIYKGMSGNKMIDQINTEKYTIIAQKFVTVQPPNNAANGLAGLTGVPNAQVYGITGNTILKFWVPGRKFGRGGNLQYENVGTDLKFFDYRWVFLAYDWYGTPQDTNNVGYINEGYTKMYYKDA